MTSTRQHKDHLAAEIGGFLRDYVTYAGRKSIPAAVLVLSGAVLEGIGLALMVPLLAVLSAGGRDGGFMQHTVDTIFGWFGATTLAARLALLLGLFTVVMVVRGAILLARDVVLAQLRLGFIEDRRIQVVEALAGASWAQVERLKHARVMQVMSADMQQIGTATYFLTQGLTALTMLVAQSSVAVMMSAPLAALSFGLLVVSAVALLPVMRQSNRLGGLLTQASQDLLHGTAQFLGGLKIAVSQNLQRGFLSEFKETLRGQTWQQIAYMRRQSQTRLAITTLSALVGAALMLIGFQVLHVAPALLLALLAVVTRMSGPAAQLQQGAQQIAAALPAYQAILSLRRELAAAAAVDGATGDVPAVIGEIRFSQVSFDHVGNGEGDAHGVKDVSLTIAPGTCIGIKGTSGSGKTTLADLLSGLYPPQSGSISVGGRPLAGALLNRWRDGIGYITQDPFLFNDTIRRNLVWANAKAGEDEIWRALELVEAAAFVRNLPEGLDTMVGERGTLVSGGERQRLALARGVLRRPHLLILDEATNAVDPATEQVIVERLLALSPKPTVVIIAHRPESLVPCDRILTMMDGRLS